MNNEAKERLRNIARKLVDVSFVEACDDGATDGACFPVALCAALSRGGVARGCSGPGCNEGCHVPGGLWQDVGVQLGSQSIAVAAL